MKIFKAIIALALLFSVGTAAPAEASEGGQFYYTEQLYNTAAAAETNRYNISIDVRGADLRDVLSALAMQMGVTIFLDAESEEVTFQANNISPGEAMDLIVQSKGLAYLQKWDIVVISEPGSLQEKYFTEMILTRFDTVFVTTDKVKAMIDELGIPCKSLTLDTSPNVIWVQGSSQALQKVRELINEVDLGGSPQTAILEYRMVETVEIAPGRAVELLEKAGVKIEHYIELDNKLIVFDQNLIPRWPDVERMVGELDTANAKKQKVFVYELKNVVSKFAAERLESFDFGPLTDEIKTVTYNKEQFSREIMVICPPNLESQVRVALTQIDQPRAKIKLPISRAKGDKDTNARAILQSKRDIYCELTGIPPASFHISDNVSGNSNKPEYVLWVEETPDRIQMLLDMIEVYEGVEVSEPVSEDDSSDDD